MRGAELEYCRATLPKVSRTFAAAIGLLDAPLESWVTVAYLLCRVVDTVEDAPGLDWSTRRALFHAFEDALDGRSAGRFGELAAHLPAGDDGDLARGLPRVLAVLETLPDEVVAAIRRHVGEMSYGMALYARRHATRLARAAAAGASDGLALTALEDERDLRRYCYFVAGTVGHLLTALFAASSDAVASRRAELARHAEGFGLLLQLTNIVKDVTDDAARGWCFVPRSFCAEVETCPEQLLDAAHRRAALRAVGQVAELASRHVEDAVRYVVALPGQAEAPRRFCLFPMLLAMRTLDLARGNAACVTPGEPVKVDRAVVGEVFGEVERLVGDDAAILQILAASPP